MATWREELNNEVDIVVLNLEAKTQSACVATGTDDGNEHLKDVELGT